MDCQECLRQFFKKTEMLRKERSCTTIGVRTGVSCYLNSVFEMNGCYNAYPEMIPTLEEDSTRVKRKAKQLAAQL